MAYPLRVLPQVKTAAPLAIVGATPRGDFDGGEPPRLVVASTLRPYRRRYYRLFRSKFKTDFLAQRGSRAG